MIIPYGAIRLPSKMELPADITIVVVAAVVIPASAAVAIPALAMIVVIAGCTGIWALRACGDAITIGIAVPGAADNFFFKGTHAVKFKRKANHT